MQYLRENEFSHYQEATDDIAKGFIYPEPFLVAYRMMWKAEKLTYFVKTVYATVLPTCGTCKSLGAKPVVGRHIHNGKPFISSVIKTSRKGDSSAP